MNREIIGYLVMFTPLIAFLACLGIFGIWWLPLAIIGGIAVVGSFVIAGLRIKDG